VRSILPNAAGFADPEQRVWSAPIASAKRAHPATLIERDSRSAFVAAVKALQLPLGAAEPPRIGRPPGIPLMRKSR
jgi:hypothetical protein